MTFPSDNRLLTVSEMAQADAATIAGGVPGERLMEAAGKAVADAVLECCAGNRIVVLCGPGNNGGDGFVAARYLREAGRDVRLFLLGQRESLKGDAALNAERWQGKTEALTAQAPEGADCVVDALFGAGLSREIDGIARVAIEAIAGRSCVAVDIPSGIHGDTGQVMGTAPQADVTVTFFRPKPGHLLMPGRLHCGQLRVVDIGIPDSVLAEIGPRNWRNDPSLWKLRFPWPRHSDHKYSRGHAVIVGGGEMTGAARMACRTALRVGAGIASVAVPPEASTIYRLALPEILVKAVRDTGMFRDVIDDPRVSACLVGPGNGVTVATREKALAILRQGVPAVLDADALTVFEETRDLLFSSIESTCVMTPHEGEFRRLFPAEGDRMTRARLAASESGAVILLKGADTIIASPDGRVAINDNAPPDLATAGAGDVLAGLIVGLLAQRVDAFDAACMAAWLHGAAATGFGPGLIAEDLPDLIPGVLRSLKEAPTAG